MSKATRDGFGEGLLELGRINPDVVALSGDLEDSARAIDFKKQYPERFFSVGIAEQDMIGVAAGLAMAGKIPFACSFAQFVTGKTLEQLRMAVCYQRLNVKVVGSHGGLSVGADGATAEALEEFTHMRSLPYMTVIVPCDAVEARKAAIASASHPGPVFLRLGRNAIPQITQDGDVYEIGKAVTLRQGEDLTMIGCGVMVGILLSAAASLEKDGISCRVINMHTVKPLDKTAIEAAARETGAILTAEEHTVLGGLGGAVAEAVVESFPVPMKLVGVEDRFGTSGDPAELMKAFKLTPEDIVEHAKALLKTKRATVQS